MNRGWTFGVVETVQFIERWFWTGMLDKAYTLSLALMPKLIRERRLDYPDTRFWARSIGTMSRCVALAESPERALIFLETAINIGKSERMTEDEENILIGAQCYPLVLTHNGSEESGRAAIAVLTKLVEIECLEWTMLATQRKFDVMKLADIGVRSSKRSKSRLPQAGSFPNL